MTPELIKQWAMEADFFKDGFDQWVAPTFATVEAFAALVAAHELEQAALVCESYQATWSVSGKEFAAALRGRTG